MVNPEYAACMELEKAISVGTRVEARWTNCYRYHRVAAEVVKVNAKSLRVKLVGEEPGYEVGRVITLPRLYSDSWTYNNGVFAPKEVV